VIATNIGIGVSVLKTLQTEGVIFTVYKVLKNRKISSYYVPS